MLAMDFGTALANLKDGHKVSRDAWNKAHYLEMAKDGEEEFIAEKFSSSIMYRDYVWCPNQSDILATDWTVSI